MMRRALQLHRVSGVAALTRTLLRASVLAWRASPRVAVANLLVAVLQGVLPALHIAVLTQLIDTVVSAAQADAARVPPTMVFLLSAWVALQATDAVCSTLSTLLSNLQRDALTHWINAALIDKANTLSIDYFEQAAFYDLLDNARRESGYRPGLIMSQALYLSRSSISVISIGALLASLSGVLMAVALLLTLPQMLISIRRNRTLFRLISSRVTQQRQMAYLSWLLTTDHSVKELRVFNISKYLATTYKAVSNRFASDSKAVYVRAARHQFWIDIMIAMCIGGVYVYVALSALSGKLSAGGIVLYYQAFQQCRQALDDAATNATQLHEHSLFLNNLFSFLGINAVKDHTCGTDSFPDQVTIGIALEHVSFHYPGSRALVLDDVSFTMRPGELTAIVGLNGAGKTTLFKLLTRLYDPIGGRITVDGIDVRRIAPDDLQRRVSVQFQDFVRYQMSLRENIALGDVSRATDEHVACAAAKAGLEEVVSALPGGYDTPLGKWFHDGQELSGGQWQKVALARALIRDSALLILDEPTASLDPRSEANILEMLRAPDPNRITMLISHRFGAARLADQIIVLDQGRVLEQGTHESLMACNGRYAELFMLQAGAYQ